LLSSPYFRALHNTRVYRDTSVGMVIRLRDRHPRNRSSLPDSVIRFIFSHKACGSFWSPHRAYHLLSTRRFYPETKRPWRETDDTTTTLRSLEWVDLYLHNLICLYGVYR